MVTHAILNQDLLPLKRAKQAATAADSADDFWGAEATDETKTNGTGGVPATDASGTGMWGCMMLCVLIYICLIYN